MYHNKVEMSTISLTLTNHKNNMNVVQKIQPWNRRKTYIAMSIVMTVQAVALLLTSFLIWSKLSYYLEDEKIMVLSSSNIWDNIHVYVDGGAYEIAILVYIFGVGVPIIRVLANTFIFHMHTKGFDSTNDKWNEPDAAINYATECDYVKLVPWLDGKYATFKDFKTLEGRMKWSSQLLTVMTLFTKVAFAQSCLCTLLLWTTSIDLYYEQEDGSTLHGKLGTVTYVGYLMFVLVLYTAYISLIILVIQENRWIRSYKQEMALLQACDNEQQYINNDNAVVAITQNMDVDDENVTERSAEDSDDLVEPLLISNNGIENETFSSRWSIANINIDKKDILLGVLIPLNFVSWMFVSCDCNIMQLKYSGTFAEDMLEDDLIQERSLFGIIGHGYRVASGTLTPFREILFFNVAFLSYVLPTITMLMCYSAEFLRKFEDEVWYRKLVFGTRCVFICSGHEPFAIVCLFFSLEVQKIIDGLINVTDECKENACLTVKSEFLPGTYLYITFAMTLTMIYRLLNLRRGHIVYRI